MKLVVGLGNPGRKYKGTRHNVGFRVAAELASRHGQTKPKRAFQGEVVEARIHDEKILLLCPHTLMNLSGGSVLAARDFYKIAGDELLIVSDDMNLPLAKLRFRGSGSSGGQKGLANIIQRLGTDEVPRLRIGIGGPPGGRDAADWVLGRFTKKEAEEIDVAVACAADAVEVWVREGIAATMNRYN
ncbi:MAG: aminoacyl-tRNA hydrolase [Planctomycetota bacterium]|nr:MAG: aminoacyl-tRNA hydrolase [Planctomycetota bacterium]